MDWDENVKSKWMTDDGHQVMAKAVTLYQHQLISKRDNIKSYPSFNSLGKSYLSFNRGEDFLEINQSETRIACGGHV